VQRGDLLLAALIDSLIVRGNEGVEGTRFVGRHPTKLGVNRCPGLRPSYTIGCDAESRLNVANESGEVHWAAFMWIQAE
jgi:hypothetical protein